VLRFGSAKAKFTANATYRQILVVQAAQAVKADALKARQHLAVVATKEAASAAVNAEAATEKVEMIAEVPVLRVLVTAVAVAVVQAAVALTGQVAQVAAVAVRVVTVQAVRERDNKLVRKSVKSESPKEAATDGLRNKMNE